MCARAFVRDGVLKGLRQRGNYTHPYEFGTMIYDTEKGVHEFLKLEVQMS